MRDGIHPNYREVVFQDMSIDFKFITRSTINTRDTIEFEGKTYPLVKIEVSAESHPFYTGKHKIVDTAGRVDKFRKKFGTVGSKTTATGEYFILRAVSHKKSSSGCFFYCMSICNSVNSLRLAKN